jgi:hypothetical protein
VAALAGGRAVVRALGSASLRAGAVGRRRASNRVGSISVQNEGWGAVADAGGARVEGATIYTAWRRWTASRSRSLFLARQRRCVRQQGASRGFWAKCSEQDVAPVTPIRHLRTANARVCTSRMPCALTAILLPESRAHGCHMLQTWFPEWTRLGCARGAGPGAAEAAEGLAGIRCEGRGNFD